jgi:hypothetical protein
VKGVYIKDILLPYDQIRDSSTAELEEKWGIEWVVVMMVDPATKPVDMLRARVEIDEAASMLHANSYGIRRGTIIWKGHHLYALAVIRRQVPMALLELSTEGYI